VVLIMQDGEQIYKDTISSYIQDGKVLLTKHGTSISVKTHATIAPKLWIEETTSQCSNAMDIKFSCIITVGWTMLAGEQISKDHTSSYTQVGKV